jgi:mycothiol synthase
VAELPRGYSARPATFDDIERVAELQERCDEALGAPYPQRPVAFLQWLWALPFMDLERDTLLIDDGERTVASAVATRDPHAGGPLRWGGRVHPQHTGRGLGRALVGWADELASALAPTGRLDVMSGTPALDRRAHRLLAGAGYAHVRNGWDMGAPLSGREVAGDPPAGVTFRRFEPGRDERTFWEVAESAFADHWGWTPSPYETWRAEWYEDPRWEPARVLLADVDGETVGECAWVEEERGAYVASLGVLEHHRGGGIGTGLLRRAIADMAQSGFRDVELSVDAENATGAVGLYERAGLTVRREDFFFLKAAAP